jgi:hypothetical protein
MGGGTSLVEARVQGRNAIGSDISSLAVFLAQVKTTPMSRNDLRAVRSWADSLGDELNLRNPAVRDVNWIRKGYQRNISTKNTAIRALRLAKDSPVGARLSNHCAKGR